MHVGDGLEVVEQVTLGRVRAGEQLVVQGAQRDPVTLLAGHRQAAQAFRSVRTAFSVADGVMTARTFATSGR